MLGRKTGEPETLFPFGKEGGSPQAENGGGFRFSPKFSGGKKNFIFRAGCARRFKPICILILPNEENIRAKFGSKKVMMKNFIDAKFQKILVPIAKLVVHESQIEKVDSEAFFNDILVHEISHGLGPGIITCADGTKTDVNKLLKDTYPAIEEAKADIGGLVSIAYLEKKGIYPTGMTNRVYVTYLAGAFRSIRFGAEEAHAKAVASSFNYIWDNGGYEYKDNRFAVNFEKIEKTVRALAAVLLEIEAKGDYQAAKAFLKKYGSMRPEMKALVDQFTTIPVDVAPQYPILDDMLKW